MAAEVLPLHRRPRSATRTRGVAELRTELAAMRDRLNLLLDQLEHAQDDEAGAPQRAPADPGPEVCLKEAARRTGWSPRRIKRQVLKHNEQHPSDRIGWQPFGAKGAEWRILLGRLQDRKADR